MNQNQVVIQALKDQLKTAKRAAARAKKKSDDCQSLGTQQINVLKLIENALDGNSPEETLKKLKKIEAKQDRINKLKKLDLIKVFDAEFETQAKVDTIQREITQMEWRETRNLGIT